MKVPMYILKRQDLPYENSKRGCCFGTLPHAETLGLSNPMKQKHPSYWNPRVMVQRTSPACAGMARS